MGNFIHKWTPISTKAQKAHPYVRPRRLWVSFQRRGYRQINKNFGYIFAHLPRSLPHGWICTKFGAEVGVTDVICGDRKSVVPIDKPVAVNSVLPLPLSK